MTIDNSQEISCPVVVLAGGLGTRLRTVTLDKPKILAPLPYDPSQSFLTFYVRWLLAQGAKHIVFSLGYRAELVIEQLHQLQASETCKAAVIDYVVEPEPLGTLGGIRFALAQKNIKEAVVLNGDTLVRLSLADFVNDAFSNAQSGFSMALIHQPDTRRFGRAIFDEHQQLQSFQEKQLDAAQPIEGWINAGVYCFTAEFSQWLLTTQEASFEAHCLQTTRKGCARRVFPVAPLDNNSPQFIDIGTPESWQSLCEWQAWLEQPIQESTA